MADPGTIGQIYVDRPHDIWDGSELVECKTPGMGLGTSRAGPSSAIALLAAATGVPTSTKPIFQATPGADTQDDVRWRLDKPNKAVLIEYFDASTWKEIAQFKLFVP